MKKESFSEEEIVKACIEQERWAQKVLYESYAHFLKGLCLRYAADEMEAEDILHDAFIQIFKTIGSYNHSGALGAWMRKVTVNKALEHYRKKSTHMLHLKQYTSNVMPSIIEDTAIENLELDDLLSLIQKLSPGYRAIFNLYAIEGYNHREIAKMLKISENTSKTQYSRARQMLRKMIEETYEKMNLNEIKINGI